MDAFAGIDVSFAKNKYLPISICTFNNGRIYPLPLKSKKGLVPPRGYGNAAIVQNNEMVKNFVESALQYLREVEREFKVKIKRIAIDAPSTPKIEGSGRREAEKGLDGRGINCIATPSTKQFDEICKKARLHLEKGGAESKIPHANQLWMLVGFELFKILRQQWECIEVFPQAIVAMLGCAQIHKSKSQGLLRQLSATASFTGWPEIISKSSLLEIGYGSFHDKLDAYLSAWVASLENYQRAPIGRLPDDVIWVPVVRSAWNNKRERKK